MGVAKKQRVFILPATKSAANRFLQKYGKNKPDYWIYLGRNATQCAEINTVIGNAIPKKDIGEELQKTSRSHRQNYIDFVGDLAKNERKPFWYLTSLSEKNPYVSQFYLNFCFMQVIISILSEQKVTFCIFCESESLAKSIKKNLEIKDDLSFSCEVFPFPVWSVCFLSLCKLIKNKSWFFARYISRTICAKVAAIARDTKKEKQCYNFDNAAKNILVYSWADNRSFPEPGKYTDSYFGDLKYYLKKQGLEITYILNILPAIWYPIAVTRLISTCERWHLFEEDITPFDVISALFEAYRLQTWNSNTLYLSGLDVSYLVREEKKEDFSDTRAEQSYLSYCAATRITPSSRSDLVIYPFENHIWEKMMICGIRSKFPAQHIIGYAHSTVNSMDLHYSISQVESNFAPLPDVLLVNGIRAKEMLGSCGFSNIPTEIIGSLRYGKLMMTPSQEKIPLKRHCILVILSINFWGSIEMIMKCSDAFRDLEETQIILKPHPAHKITDYAMYMAGTPGSFIISTDPLQILFEKTDLVIYTDSTASVEAAVKRIPILHIKSSFTIDINIFEDSGLILSAHSPAQIREYAMKLLNGDERNRSDEIQTFIKSLFAPVDEKKILSIVCCQKKS